MAAEPVRFLLVEDDDGHAGLVRLAFEESHVGNRLDRVRDGAAALAYLRRQGPYANQPRPDVILLDLKLPGMDGHEILREIKQDPDLRSIPVVVLTTSADEADKARAYDNRANSYIVKPVDFEKFHRTIQDLNLYWSVWNELPDTTAAGPR